MRIGRSIVAIISAATCALTMTAAPAIAGNGDRWGHPKPEPIKVIATGLLGPLQLADGGGSSLLVTQAFAGEITKVNVRTGEKTPIIQGAFGASGATRIGGKIAFVTGGGGGPAATVGVSTATARVVPSPPMTIPPDPSSLYVAKAGQTPTKFADLLEFEEGANPDGQDQNNPEFPDAVSNPFSVVPDRSHRGFAIVADGGANDVLRVDDKGNVKAFFVPPVITAGECAGRPNNDPEHTGCDPVPTGMAYGPRNTLYVATLSGEAAGLGRVYLLDARTGKVKKYISGFNSPTGVAVDNRGNIYVSELLNNQIVKVDHRGKRSYAAVTEPSAVFISGGKLYSTAQAFTDGQIIQVNDSAFGKYPVPPPTPAPQP